MNRSIHSNTSFETLRKKAEEIVRSQEPALPYANEPDLMRLVHEVEVQHVELEIQNEELRRATKELEASRNEFAELYETAPVAFVTLSAKGIVEQANAAAARLWCDLNGLLVGRSFSSLIVREDQAVYFSHLKELALNRDSGSCELRLRQNEGPPVYVQMEAAARLDAQGRVAHWHVALLDISERRQKEQLLKRYHLELEREVACRTTEIESQKRELEQLNRLNRLLSQKTLEAMENDRRALSKELHDSIGGTLAAIKMQLESRLANPMRWGQTTGLMSIEKIVSHLTEAIQETRRISSQLRSLALDDFGLDPALKEHFQQFSEFYPNIRIVPQIDIQDADIPAELQTVLYRVIQEALNNTGKHSQATRVFVRLTQRRNQVVLEVADDGAGFDLQEILSEEPSVIGYGLHSMRERVELCQGTFEIHSTRKKGTRIDISIPFQGRD
ncbi:MAG: ATP-binding protein [Desulfobacterales bacterium]